MPVKSLLCGKLVSMRARLSAKLGNKLAMHVRQATDIAHDQDSLNQQLQLQLKNQWIQWREAACSPYKSIKEAGFRCYSQFEEDGIILYLATMLGISNGTVLEICCGHGRECMATNLILNHGFKGYLFDGSAENISSAHKFFSGKHDCLLIKPELRHAWITKDNVSHLISEIECPSDVDFLSLDIDGNDYWIWEAINTIMPKFCCFETHNVIPSGLSLTIPYDPGFSYLDSDFPDFRSASLLAMVKLSKSKGYRLIGAHRHGFNVFFMRNDLGIDCFPEVSIDEVHANEWTRISQSNRWPAVSSCNWVEV